MKLRPCLAALILAGMALLASCAPKPAIKPLDTQEAKATWEAFESQPPAAKAFELAGSLNLVTPQKSTRVVLNFRGDLDGALRLDLSSGSGTTFAMWREGQAGWLGVYPLSNKAYSHPDTKKALAKLGLPLPFNLRDLSALLTGRYSWVIPPAYQTVKMVAQGYEYTLPSGSRLASVTLDQAGNPLRLVGRGVEPWSVELSDFSPINQGEKPLARKMTLTTPGGTTALFRVKKLELLPENLPAQALELPLAPSMKLINMDNPSQIHIPDMP